MIKIEIAYFCQDCPEFEANVEKNVTEVVSFGFTSQTKCNHIIRCTHQQKCEAIMNHLKYERREEA